MASLALIDDRLEALIHRWRRQVSRDGDTEALESRLRDEVEALAGLIEAGLAPDEAFLVAAKRVGALDGAVSATQQAEQPGLPEGAEAAEARSSPEGCPLPPTSRPAGGTLRRPTTTSQPASGAGAEARREFLVMGALACGAAVMIKVPEVFDLQLSDDGEFYGRNVSLLVLPFLAGYLAWKRRLCPRRLALLAAPFVVAAVVMNAYPFERSGTGSDTEVLAAMHLPILLWLVVGVAHAAGDWRSHDRRMDFVRFTGEWVIHYGLIALGGAVFAASTQGVFAAIGLEVAEFVWLWLVPCGAAGAVVVAAWLAESSKGVLERIAPVLARLFAPLFTLMLVVFLVTLVLTGRWIDVGRDTLIFFAVLLALILGLVIHTIAVRDPQAPPGLWDALQLALVTVAVLVDLLVLAAVAGRIADFGATPNRVAVLGENLVLLGNLAWSAWLYVDFLRGRRRFGDLERWQSAYATVYAVWLAAVVLVLPPVFNFT